MGLRKLKVLALIPARSGSKGIKNKNMYPINRRYLIDFTLEAAISSSFVDHVYVSSDSKKILEHAEENLALPVQRPRQFSKDTSTASEVIYHFYDFLISNDLIERREDFYLSYLQPTSPLRNSKILDESFSALEKSNMDCLISLVKDKQTPFKSFLIKDGLVQSLFKESDTNKNRQDLQPTYRANGAIYTFLISEFLRNKGFPSNASIPFIMSEEASLDIDSYEDLDTLKSRL